MSGTIFQDSHQPLTIWFRAIWNIVSQKYGANALGIHRTVGISYTSSWYLLHKLRRAMVRPGREKLSGTVEVDEAYIGGFAEGSPGRKGDKKALVVFAVEQRGKGMGRVRMRVIDSATGENLLRFISENVEEDSTVVTDGWRSYSKVSESGYKHKIEKIRMGQEVLPRVHTVVSLVKRWLLGTYQGGVETKNLDYYLDEYTFRFNGRTSRSRGKLFRRLLEQAVETAPVTREGLFQDHDK
jgi:transposase-like protein